MADGVTLGTNAEKILRKFERLPKKLQSGVRKGIKRGLLITESRVLQGADLTFSGSRSGLASRLTSAVELGNGAIGIDGVIGFRKAQGFPYELSQEYGARAKSGGAMAIPVSPEARAARERGISAGDFPADMFIPKGTHVLAEDLGLASFRAGGGMFKIHYVLVKSIPPRLNFRKSVRESFWEIGKQVVKGMKEAKRDV